MNAISYGKLLSITPERLERALFNDGFQFSRQRGSHRRYKHHDGRRVTIPFGRKTLKIGTLESIIDRQARWTEEDLIRLGLIKKKAA